MNGAPRLKILKYANALRLLSMPKQLSSNDPNIQFAPVRGQIRPKTEAERDLNRIPVVEA